MMASAVTSSAPALIAQTASVAPSIIQTLATNVKVVGGLWMVSSAILTTYSTTKFLKYHDDNNNNNNINTDPHNQNHRQATSHRLQIKNKLKHKHKAKGAVIPSASKKSLLHLSLSRPALLTLYRFGGSLLLGLILHPDFQIVHRIQQTVAAIPAFMLPAVFLYIANYSNSIALNRIGIGLTYTSKCAIPIFTVLVTWLLDGATALPSLQTLLCLVPIATGIGLASWDSPVFEAQGFGFAMLSCSAQTALNVSSKKALAKTGLSGSDGLRAMVAVGLVITIMTTLTTVFFQNSNNSTESNSSDMMQRSPPAWLSFLAFTAYHLEYVLSFSFVRLVAPVAYGASDAVRRLSIIISGHYMFGHDRFTRINILGIATALVGALGYAISSHAF